MTTELDDILALVGRVLPDPTGFVERLFQQAVVRWADPAAAAGDQGANPLIVPAGLDPDSEERIADTNALLASALGACECWGARPECPECSGRGAAGWAEPDPQLFHMFVGPAVERLSPDSAERADATSGGPS